MGKKKKREPGGLLTPEQLEKAKPKSQVMKERQEAMTGVPVTADPWTPKDRDKLIDTYLEHWPHKGRIKRILIQKLPERSNDHISHNDPFEQFVARGKSIVPVKDPLRRSGEKWSEGDDRVCEIVTRPKNVERGSEVAARVALLLRRSVDEVVPHVREWLIRQDTYTRAVELGHYRR